MKRNDVLITIFFLKLTEWLLFPFVLISSLILRYVRTRNLNEMELTRSIFYRIGIYPILDHYYEPLFNPKHANSIRISRNLPGIDLNDEGQISVLKQFSYNAELLSLPIEKKEELKFYYHNTNFGSGDAEYFYNIIRTFKPKKILEIGCGFSTLLAEEALLKNLNQGYNCEHICVEPYEMPWLEKLHVKVIRAKVEQLDRHIFESLESNDILFIDSSHMIRRNGDVVFEYLEIFPLLRTGVLVHIHDIFTPFDYPFEWLSEKVLFWNEQYLLEAFLSLNSGYEVIGALNYLKHKYFDELTDKCPILKNEPSREPGSFWLKKKK